MKKRSSGLDILLFLFSITLFLSAGLIFLVQPMVAKMILPLFGGSPAVWTASILFFQCALLFGYAYAHWAPKVLGTRLQTLVHIVLLAVVIVLFLPFSFQRGSYSGEGKEVLYLLSLLTINVGPSFFLAAASAPLLQKWFARTSHPEAGDPYFLYVASNLGSMLALLSYPILLEPVTTLTQQNLIWANGYKVLALFIFLCALVVFRRQRNENHETPPLFSDESAEGVNPTSLPHTNADGKYQIFRWLALSFVPSSMLLGVTSYLTTNITPMPLLWVIPLALYLFTFILAFSRRFRISTTKLGRWYALLIAPLSMVIIFEAAEPMWLLLALHLLVFFLAALMCHSELARSRPRTQYLTSFYLWIALGGALGGAFNAIVAPYIFKTLAEYPLALVLACFLRPSNGEKASYTITDALYPLLVGSLAILAAVIAGALRLDYGTARTLFTLGIPVLLCFFAIDRIPRFALSLGSLFLAASILAIGAGGRVLYSDRSFFGVHRVLSSNAGRFHTLVHGNTVHGRQSMLPDERYKPLTYYHPTGPIGQVFLEFSGPKQKKNIALVGLGTGSLAAYANPGQNVTFFEIDEEVVRIAENPKLFTYLQDCKAKYKIVLGDARITLMKEPPHRFGIIVLDAFNSDSIPVHLITKEAVEMYLTKLEEGGILAFHISNRYLELSPVLAGIADSLGLVCRLRIDSFLTDEEQIEGKLASRWVLLARKESDLGSLAIKPEWERVLPDRGARVWTDDYSHILSVFKKLPKFL
ncbi:MAG TPA: fused MFS/spermidine synthase [Fimbriimonadales bacterium]|nr:fused MFS/spermidine synthase [Fimbriimonadales bacterium]